MTFAGASYRFVGKQCVEGGLHVNLTSLLAGIELNKEIERGDMRLFTITPQLAHGRSSDVCPVPCARPCSRINYRLYTPVAAATTYVPLPSRPRYLGEPVRSRLPTHPPAWLLPRSTPALRLCCTSYVRASPDRLSLSIPTSACCGARAWSGRGGGEKGRSSGFQIIFFGGSGMMIVGEVMGEVTRLGGD